MKIIKDKINNYLKSNPYSLDKLNKKKKIFRDYEISN